VGFAIMKKISQRRLVRLGIITVVVLSLLGLLLLYAPRYVARYLLASQLDELKIDHSGVETLVINPFTREVWLGPVSLGGGPSGAARLDSLGLTLGYNPLLHHRILIERLIVRGIDLAVTRDKSNRFILNGIPLNELLPPPGGETEPPKEGEAWKPGVAEFELRDSRLLFQDQNRGDLAVALERLVLKDFLAWQPDDPGRFELQGQVNDIQLDWSGEARPFADNITLSFASSTAQADLPKVIRFTGPLGLDRRDGVFQTRLEHELTLFHKGGFEGSSQGVIEVEGADYQRKGVFSLAMQRAKSDLDVHYALNTTGDFSLHGEVKLDLGSGQVSIEDKTRVGVAGGRVGLEGLESTRAKNGNLSLNLRPKLDLDQVAFSGPIEISVDKLLDLLAMLQSLSAGAEVSKSDTGLGDFAGNDVAVPASDVKVERLHSQGESLSLQSNDGKFEFALKAQTELSNIQVGVDERVIKVERLQSDLEHLKLSSGQGHLALDLAGSNTLTSGSSKSPIGQLQVDSLASHMAQFALQVQTGAITLQTAGENQAKGFSGKVYAEGSTPEVALQLAGASSSLSKASLDVQGDKVQWQAAGDASADALAIEFAGGKESEMKFDRVAIQGLQADQRLQLAADAMDIDGLDLTLKRSVLESLIERAADERQQAESTQAPDNEAAAAEPNELARAQDLLRQLGYDTGGVDGRMGPQTTSAIKAFQAQEGIQANGRMSAGLLAQLELRAAAASDGADSGPALQVGHLALNGDPVVRFLDDVIEPPVKIDTRFKTFQVENLNTRVQAQKSDIQLVASINEFTDLEITGWTRGLSKVADLDLDVQVKNLELATYSPYVVKLSGVYLDSGQMDTRIEGKATGGILQGQIRLGLDHVEFKPLNEEDAARVTDVVGVPLEMAVSLLEDNSGHIALKLPVSGTLTKPDVDISSAVNKAIGGMLKRVFPPTLAVSLLSKLTQGGGPAFEPIVFTPGSAQLDEAGRSYADEVAKFLRERPKVSLKLCGRATAQDLAQLTSSAESESETAAEASPAAEAQAEGEATQAGTENAPDQEPQPDQARLADDLKELAIERKNVVRTYLVEEKKIEAGRVPECRSTYDPDDQGSPRVKISF